MAKVNENIYSLNETGSEWERLTGVIRVGPVRDPGRTARSWRAYSGNAESFITTGEWRAREIARSSRQAARGVALRY